MFTKLAVVALSLAASSTSINAAILVALSTSQGDIDAYLNAHNGYRAEHGAAPLKWNEDMAQKAQKWANSCNFEHSGGSLGEFGENLAAGTGNYYEIATAVKEWYDEVRLQSQNPVPSHFTQVVWKGSSELGCAVATCPAGTIFFREYGDARYYVCEYSKPGNVIGQFPQNVQK